MTIADIKRQTDREELTVNEEYQRSNQVWPGSAKSYFIDTILAGFPFPKIYIYAHYGDGDGEEMKKEIVDGQQRVYTMIEYLRNDFYVSTPTSEFKRKHYKDLDPEDKQRYLNTVVEIDLILQAEQKDVLEMFRRMNSYMAPLKPAEKRHAEFQGDFKWFINALADEYSPVLQRYGVLRPTQVVRMGDAEFITELAQILDVGIVNRSNAAFTRIYKKYDKKFASADDFEAKIGEFFDLLTSTLKPLASTPLMKTYNLYSLFCALVGRKYGFPGSRDIGIKKRGTFFKSAKTAVAKLKRLAEALESEAIEGQFADYLAAAAEATTRIATREPRARLIAEYLDA